ncbi:NUDIX hydrolase, partial [Candidatus Bathyarchaeota archaeon]
MKEGETIENALKREMKEEIGIIPKDFEKVGIIEFQFQGNPEILEVHFFKINEFTGIPRESEEMKPKWFDIG